MNNQIAPATISMFTEPDTWNGGSIELLVALGPSSAERRANTSRAVWSWPALRGPYLHPDVEPNDQAVIETATEERCYGVAYLPDELGSVAFAVYFVEDDQGLWLYAGTPLGSLGSVLPVGAFPFGQSTSAGWELTVHKWMFGLAQHIFAEVSFERAVIGWLTAVEADELASGIVPELRGHGYVVATTGKIQYFAPNLNKTLLA